MVVYPPSWVPRERIELPSRPLMGRLRRETLGGDASHLICLDGSHPGDPARGSMMGGPRVCDHYSRRVSMMGGPRLRDCYSRCSSWVKQASWSSVVGWLAAGASRGSSGPSDLSRRLRPGRPHWEVHEGWTARLAWGYRHRAGPAPVCENLAGPACRHLCPGRLVRSL